MYYQLQAAKLHQYIWIIIPPYLPASLLIKQSTHSQTHRHITENVTTRSLFLCFSKIHEQPNILHSLQFIQQKKTNGTSTKCERLNRVIRAGRCLCLLKKSQICFNKTDSIVFTFSVKKQSVLKPFKRINIPNLYCQYQ